MPRKYWSIKHYDTGSGIWINDTQIPRAGLDPFTRNNQSTNDFLSLADGSIAVTTSETKSNWQEIKFTFPKQVVTEALRTQFLNYLSNNQGVSIVIPLSTGASSYTERTIEGYFVNYNEERELGRQSQRYTLIMTMREFDVDGV